MFIVNDTTGRLTPVTTSPVSNADAGTAASALTFSPNAELLAMTNLEGDAVSVFTVNGTQGN